MQRIRSGETKPKAKNNANDWKTNSYWIIKRSAKEARILASFVYPWERKIAGRLFIQPSNIKTEHSHRSRGHSTDGEIKGGANVVP